MRSSQPRHLGPCTVELAQRHKRNQSHQVWQTLFTMSHYWGQVPIIWRTLAGGKTVTPATKYLLRLRANAETRPNWLGRFCSPFPVFLPPSYSVIVWCRWAAPQRDPDHLDRISGSLCPIFTNSISNTNQTCFFLWVLLVVLLLEGNVAKSLFSAFMQINKLRNIWNILADKQENQNKNFTTKFWLLQFKLWSKFCTLKFLMFMTFTLVGP